MKSLFFFIFFIFSYHLYGFDLPSFSFKSITYALSLQEDIIPAWELSEDFSGP